MNKHASVSRSLSSGGDAMLLILKMEKGVTKIMTENLS